MTAIDTKEPMVAFILANPNKTFVLKNDEAGRADATQNAVFDVWCGYLRDTRQTDKLRTWRWMRAGGSKALTLPCADPAEYDRGWAFSGYRSAAE